MNYLNYLLDDILTIIYLREKTATGKAINRLNFKYGGSTGKRRMQRTNPMECNWRKKKEVMRNRENQRETEKEAQTIFSYNCLVCPI